MTKITRQDQLELDLSIVTEVEANGVGMGVLSNGAAYLTGRGLARLCGVDQSTIVKLTNEWQISPPRPRVAKIRKAIREDGGDDGAPFIPIVQNSEIKHHAFPEHVCMAVLEYYALDSSVENQHARKAYKTLARKGFVDFVYDQVGLARDSSIKDFSTKQFMDRIGMVHGVVPQGYFSVFKEISDMFAALIAQNVKIDAGFVPDISVGLAWSKFWKSENLDSVYGMRDRFEHQYPKYFPQSAAGPQDAFCYPEEALGEFRKWMREVYYRDKLPNYLNKKVRDGGIASSSATAIVSVYKAPPQLKN